MARNGEPNRPIRERAHRSAFAFTSRTGVPCRSRMSLPGSVQRTSPRAQGLRLREVLPSKPIRDGRCCLLCNGTRSAPRNWTRFAAQYLARGLPCERFTSALAGRRASTRGRGGWLVLTPRGTFTSYSLPAFLAHSASGHERRCPLRSHDHPCLLRPGSD